MGVVAGKKQGFLQEIYIIFRVFTDVVPMNKKLLIVPGYLVGIGGVFLITYRTLLAFFSESKSITIQVNRYGEQYGDIVVLVFLWIVCVVGVVSLLLLLKEEKVGNGVVGKSDEATVVEKPGVSLGGVPGFFLDEPPRVVVGAFGELFNEIDQRYFLLDDEGTGGVFSVSVTVLADDAEE